MPKLVTLDAFFPELKGGSAYQVARGEGGTWQVAAKRALDNLAKQVSRKRFSTAKITVSISETFHDNEASYQASEESTTGDNDNGNEAEAI